MIGLAVRCDDPSATLDRVLEEGKFAATETAGTPFTFAVIPFRRREDDLILLHCERTSHLVDALSADVIEVIQHGNCHESILGGKQPPSDFMGVDAARQTEWICATLEKCGYIMTTTGLRLPLLLRIFYRWQYALSIRWHRLFCPKKVPWSPT